MSRRGLETRDLKNLLALSNELFWRGTQDQVEVASKNRDVTQENLSLTRQRYEAGVPDNVEVVQSQDAVAARRAGSYQQRVRP
jgi:hypothetical protein